MPSIWGFEFRDENANFNRTIKKKENYEASEILHATDFVVVVAFADATFSYFSHTHIDAVVGG